MRRSRFINNVKDVLWAGAFAGALWFLVDQNTRQFKDEIPVRLVVEPPVGYTVNYLTQGNVPPDATIAVSAPRSVMEKLSEWRGRVGTYSLGQIAPSEVGKELTLKVKDFDFVLPPDVKLEPNGIQPQTIRVVIDVMKQALLAVDLKYEGPLPEGFEIDDHGVVPATVWASGPKDKMEAEPHLETEKINVQEQLRLVGWRPAEKPRPEISVPVHVKAPEGSGISPVGAGTLVMAWVRLRPKQMELPREVQPELLIPVPGFRYKLTPLAGAEKVKCTLVGPELDLKEPGLAATLSKLRALAVVPPGKLGEIEQNVGKIYKLDVEVVAPPGIRVKDAQQKYDVNVSEWAPPPTTSGG